MSTPELLELDAVFPERTIMYDYLDMIPASAHSGALLLTHFVAFNEKGIVTVLAATPIPNEDIFPLLRVAGERGRSGLLTEHNRRAGEPIREAVLRAIPYISR